MSDYIDIVFDGPPGPTSGRFVEVENPAGESIKIGEWVQRDDFYWVLRLPDPDEIQRLKYYADLYQESAEKEAAEVHRLRGKLERAREALGQISKRDDPALIAYTALRELENGGGE